MSCSRLTFDFDELPDEVKLEIFSFLNTSTLLKCAQVCTEWKALVDDDSLWLEKCRRHWADKQMHALTPIREKRLRAQNRPWKRLYYEAQKDSRRAFITKDELCALKWHFSFKGFNWRGVEQHPEFRGDKLIMNDMVMDWRFTGNSKVQVEEYPPLTAYRTADWGWRMENPFVTFLSLPDYQTPKSKRKSAPVVGSPQPGAVAQLA
jgi:hypothetical protein